MTPTAIPAAPDQTISIEHESRIGALDCTISRQNPEGEAAAAHQLSRELFAEGVLATGIGFPTVPKGKARVRTIVTATHTKAELDQALEVFRKVGKKLGILG